MSENFRRLDSDAPTLFQASSRAEQSEVEGPHSRKASHTRKHFRDPRGRPRRISRLWFGALRATVGSLAVCAARDDNAFSATAGSWASLPPTGLGLVRSRRTSSPLPAPS